jgi:hypothetical protein
MKRFLVVLAMLVSFNSFAHHLDALGWCSTGGGKAFFITVQFSNNLNVQVQYKPFNASGNSDPWLTGYNFNTTTSGNTTAIIGLPQPVKNQRIKVRFRYKNTSSSTWGSWSTEQNSLTTSYAGCGTLPVKFSSFSVEHVKDLTFKVTFKIEAGEDVRQFNVMVSEDGVNFKQVMLIFPDTLDPNRTYSQTVTIKN